MQLYKDHVFKVAWFDSASLPYVFKCKKVICAMNGFLLEEDESNKNNSQKIRFIELGFSLFRCFLIPVRLSSLPQIEIEFRNAESLMGFFSLQSASHCL